jgi:hypothetical protein
MAVRPRPGTYEHLLNGGEGAPRPRRQHKARRKPKPQAVGCPTPFVGRLLSLDPSSTCVGWSLFDRGKLVDCGLVRRTHADVRVRTAELVAEVMGVYFRAAPDRVVMEVATGLHRKARPMSLASLCFAQGAIWAALCPHSLVVCIPENTWTRGGGRRSIPKRERARWVRATEPAYGRFADGDVGFDIADSIGVGRFFLNGFK